MTKRLMKDRKYIDAITGLVTMVYWDMSESDEPATIVAKYSLDTWNMQYCFGNEKLDFARDVAEFAAVLREDLGAIISIDFKGVVLDLLLLADIKVRLNLDSCNTGLTEEQEAMDDGVGGMAEAICDALNMFVLDGNRIEIETNNDPRGFPIKLKLPSGRSNSFAGQVWGVPFDLSDLA